MLEKIKSNYISKKVLEYINNKTMLNIFKFSKFYQSKFGFNKYDYLFELFDIFSFDLNYSIYIENEPDFVNEEYLFNSLRYNLSQDISNDILKEGIIKYFGIRNDYILSINHIYFNEIIEKKIELGHKNIKIKFDFTEYLSQNNIIDLITQRKSNETIINYINKRIEFNNNTTKKLQFLLNSNIIIKELYFNLTKDNISTYSIDYQKDIIEYKENQIDDEKNILINFKLKIGELINKIIEKNYKNIKKMNYLLFDKISLKNNNQIFPLIELDKFENLIFLDLKIFYNGDFDNEIIYIDFYNDRLSLYIQKETLNQLETLKIKNINWFVKESESFNLKNIIKLHINNCILPEVYNNKNKYFFKEILKGDISWEKLEKMKISLTFDNIKDIKEEYINKEIINFLKVAKERESYEDATSEFFPNFFSFIFNNQIIYIKTNENNKSINEFKIKIYDIIKCGTCQIKPIIYEKNRKNVNITVNGRLYGKPVLCYNGLQESPLKYINLDNIIINPSLDSFTIDHHTINELKEIKNFISEQHKKIEKWKIDYEQFKKKYHYYSDKDKLKKEINELKLKEDLFRNEKSVILKDLDKKSYFEKTICYIKEISLSDEIHQIVELNKILNKKLFSIRKKNEIQIDNKEEDNALEIGDLGDLFND